MRNRERMIVLLNGGLWIVCCVDSEVGSFSFSFIVPLCQCQCFMLSQSAFAICPPSPNPGHLGGMTIVMGLTLSEPPQHFISLKFFVIPFGQGHTHHYSLHRWLSTSSAFLLLSSGLIFQLLIAFRIGKMPSLKPVVYWCSGR